MFQNYVFLKVESPKSKLCAIKLEGGDVVERQKRTVNVNVRGTRITWRTERFNKVRAKFVVDDKVGIAGAIRVWLKGQRKRGGGQRTRKELIQRRLLWRY